MRPPIGRMVVMSYRNGSFLGMSVYTPAPSMDVGMMMLTVTPRCPSSRALALTMSLGVGLTTGPAVAGAAAEPRHLQRGGGSRNDQRGRRGPGTGRDQFNCVGSGWGHAGGEGAPANPYDRTNS